MAKKEYATYNTLGEEIDNASKGVTVDPNKDYSSELKKQIASGADYNTVYDTLAARINKATNTEGLEQYAWDSTTRDAINYLLTYHDTPGTYIDANQAAEETRKYNQDVANGVATDTLANRVAALEQPIENLEAARGSATANPTQQTAAKPPSSSVSTGTTSSTTSSNDYSDYLTQMYEEKKKAGLASLKAAYDKNVNSLNAAGQKIPGVYNAAKNQTAANAAVAQRNFNQQAAAAGLGSGTSAQATLANSVALQGNLNSINQAEADALAELQLQRTNLDTEYNNAIAEAEANGNYELAAALYEEKVRVDEYLAQQEAAQVKAQQQAYEDGLAMAEYLFKNSGDASGLKKYGYTDEQVANLEAQWKIDNAPKVDNTQKEKDYQNGLALAQYLYQTTGDASGFAQYGYTPAQIANMQNEWKRSAGLLEDTTPEIEPTTPTEVTPAYSDRDFVTIQNVASSYLQQRDKAGLLAYLEPLLPNFTESQTAKMNKILDAYKYEEWE